ncbi:MAG: peptidylprolyl isomerase [Firmicutes bacterium]|nr:peptidylprolyl isomerase [Bacillota bacterium]
MDTQAKIEQRREEARKRQQQIKKRENAKISQKTKRSLAGIGATIVAILLIAALILPNTGLSRRMLKALTIGDKDISVAEFSYYYRLTFNNYYQTMYSYFQGSYMPIDMTKSLKKQAYNDDMSYADYFSQQAKDNLQQLVILSEEAKKANFTLPEDVQNVYQTTLDGAKNNAEQEGVSVNTYLSNNFGMGFNMDTLEKCVYRELLAEAYKNEKQASFTFTDADLEAYYQENSKDFDVADIRLVRFSVVEGNETTEAVTAEEAKAQADAFIEGITTEEEFAEKAVAKAEAEAEEGAEVQDTSRFRSLSFDDVTNVDVNLCDWIFNQDHADGSVAVVENASGDAYFAVYLTKAPYRNDSKTVDVRHILVRFEDTTEESKEAAKSQAEMLYEQFLSYGATEDYFATLAQQFSSDTGSQSNGGLYTGVYEGQMVDAFNDWCFDEARFAGDSGIIETEYGYHIMYFVGDNLPSWKMNVQNTLQTNAYSDWYMTVAEQYPVKEHAFAMKYRSEPI